MTRRESTIIDVARLAEVSSATVSRALRGHSNVTPETRRRVEEAANSLNYRADPSAARLASGQSTSIALIVPFVDRWYFGAVMAGVELELTEVGYEIAVHVTSNETARHRLLAHPMPRGTGGMVICDISFAAAEVDALLARGMPAVSIGMELDGVSSVTVDDEAVGRTATQHLLDLGHRSIALLGIDNDPQLRFNVPQRRRAGYHEALRAAGVQVRSEFDVDGRFSVIDAHRAMGRLLDLEDPPTAVFSMSDEMAFGATKAIRDHGLRVPEDISIVGVDDHPLSWAVELTTVQQEVSNHGSIAAREVLERIDNPDRPLTFTEAETSLVVRGSTGPAPSSLRGSVSN